jgi:hypothetical protein
LKGAAGRQAASILKLVDQATWQSQRRRTAFLQSEVPVTGGSTPALFLLPKHLPVGLAVRIEAVMFTAFPSNFQFGPSDIPVWTTFPQDNAQVLPKFLDGRSAKKSVSIVDLKY